MYEHALRVEYDVGAFDFSHDHVPCMPNASKAEDKHANNCAHACAMCLSLLLIICSARCNVIDPHPLFFAGRGKGAKGPHGGKGSDV